MITTASLKTQTWKDLAEMAKSKGLAGWSAMRKNDLVKALLRATKVKSRPKSAPPSKSKSKTLARGKSTRKPIVAARNGHAKNGHAAKNGHSGKNGHSNGSATGARPSAKQTKVVQRIQKVHVGSPGTELEFAL